MSFNFRTRYGAPMRHITTFSDPSLTQQQFKDECDLELLINRCRTTGFPLPSPHDVPIFGDLSVTPSSLHEAMNLQCNVERAFASLPQTVRKRFSSPMQLLEFLEDSSNRKEAIELGLVKSDPASPAAPAASVTPSEPSASVTPSEPSASVSDG